MPVNTYFGDVITTGNTTLKQNLIVQGAFSYFVSNLGTSTDQVGSIGVGTAWNSVYVTGSNATTMNLTSISEPVGINTASGIGATVTVTGNVYTTNSIQSTNVIVTNSNSTSLNTSFVVTPTGFLGINSTTPSGTVLYVNGNTYVTNSITTSNTLTTNVNVSGTTNVSTLVATSNIGIGTSPLRTNLYVLGNAFFTNALTTSNIFTTNVNVSGTSNLSTTNVFIIAHI